MSIYRNKILCSCIECKTEITSNNINKHYKSRGCIIRAKINYSTVIPDVCNFCHKKLGKFAVKHINYCKLNPNRKEIKSSQYNTNIEPCKFCNKICKNSNSLGNHQARCKLNPNRIIHVLTEAGKESIRISNREIEWTSDRRKKHSNSMKLAVEKFPDSYSSNNVCGRVKIYEYNESKFHGTWEVIVAKWLDANNIIWTRNTNPISYFWNNDIHKYFPDFYLPELDLFIEVKGYERPRDLAKYSVVNNLIIIKAKEIDLIISGNFSIL